MFQRRVPGGVKLGLQYWCARLDCRLAFPGCGITASGILQNWCLPFFLLREWWCGCRGCRGLIAVITRLYYQIHISQITVSSRGVPSRDAQIGEWKPYASTSQKHRKLNTMLLLSGTGDGKKHNGGNWTFSAALELLLVPTVVLSLHTSMHSDPPNAQRRHSTKESMNLGMAQALLCCSITAAMGSGSAKCPLWILCRLFLIYNYILASKIVNQYIYQPD
jgi:hypothetical protein